MRKIKIAYIGGGSKQWARVFMNDLALADEIEGEIALYDIDMEAALRNKQIGERINQCSEAVSKWDYIVKNTIEDALTGADFVVISILPGTFEEMRSDVHTPEKYGIYQAVGDTVGPGGVLRAMRTVPLYEGFAEKIKECCPDSWVINFTNPMSICTKTLYDVFPQIKAFGCCHEVFHAQEFLCCVLHEELDIEKPNRTEIYTDASGVNHFTWITEAKYNNIDILKLLPSFTEKYYESGYYEREGFAKDEFKRDCFAYGNKVKLDMFARYKALGAAGDRHLVEFMNNNWYINSKEAPKEWLYQFTTVDFRIKQCEERIAESIALANGSKEVKITKSNEEAVELIKAILGLKTVVSNVNMPNVGQMPGMPIGSIVETNCVFSNDCVKPVVSTKLPTAVLDLVLQNNYNIETCYEGIKNRDLDTIFASFVNQPLCCNISIESAKKLFKEMVMNTREYLDPFFDSIDSYFSGE